MLCTDAVVNFVTHLQQAGHDTQYLNVLTDELTGHYDLLLANMVFLHFEPDQIEMVLGKVSKVLKPAGILAFSVRTGTGSGWTNDKLGNPRYYHYWNHADLGTLVEKCGFTITDMRDGDSTNPDKIYVIARQS